MSTKTILELRAGDWAHIEVKVEQLWESDHKSVSQVGVFTDETGIIKFVVWKKSELPLMEEGVIYKIGKVPVTEFDGRLQVAVVKTSVIERVSEPVVETDQRTV